MPKRMFTPSEDRGLTVRQKEYLEARPYIFSLQPHSMLLPREQLYQTLRHGAVTVDQAMELDAVYDRLQSQRPEVPAQCVARDNYSDAEDRFIDRHGMSSGLS